MAAQTPGERKQLLVRRLVEARRNDESAVFEAADVSLRYDDRTLRIELDAEERDRLSGLLDAYHVFKIQQPETRKAGDGIVYLSAVTDAKHAADFIDALFVDVYGHGEEYTLTEG
jgi:hypothetical protein